MKWAKATETWHQEDRTVHVYFDNDAEGAAPKDAMKLKKINEAM
jgi:uncharacterized protein YecE (DUF72 family)